MNRDKEIAGFEDLEAFKDHPVNQKLDEAFRSTVPMQKPKVDPMSSPVNKAAATNEPEEIVLDELEIDFGIGNPPLETSSNEDQGLDLNFSDEASLELGENTVVSQDSDFGDLSLDENDESPHVNLGDLDLPDEEGLSLIEAETVIRRSGLNNSDDNLDGLSLNDDSPEDLSFEGDLSDDAKEKLKEIDAIMDDDASNVNLKATEVPENVDNILDQPLVSDDLDLDSLNFGNGESEDVTNIQIQREEKSKKKKKDNPADRGYGQDLKEISGAYSGEMERMQATIANLRSDRDELLSRIEKLEEAKVLQNRQGLSVRAELDEKKIELTIMRKKLNEEITDLRDRLKFFDEKKLILEERNKVLMQELDKASQKNKMDVKKVQLREKELEQKLELLKSDAESQIRHRDLKILELKRKIDAMEFDMESISMQEKRSVESRFELEDKLEKAIKTLRGAITVLEDGPDRTNALNALKKNIDM
jgi:hypothetical protein